MLKTTHRTWAQARRSAYIDPIGLAEQLLDEGKPLPLDLQADLEAMGFMVDEFCESYKQAKYGCGFSLVDPEYHSEHLSA